MSEFDEMAKRVAEVWNNAIAKDKQNKMTESYKVPVEENENGDAVITLPDEILKSLDLKEGDSLDWKVKPDGSIVLSKKK